MTYKPKTVSLWDAVNIVDSICPSPVSSPIHDALREEALLLYDSDGAPWKYSKDAIWWPNPLGQTFPGKGQTSCYDLFVKTEDLERLWPENPDNNGRETARKADKKALQGENKSEVNVQNELEINYRTGLPGKPTNRILIEREFDRRIEIGKIENSLKRQAEVISEWLKEAHPNAPPATVKTIENLIRKSFWAAPQ